MLLEEIEVRFAVPCRIVLSAHEDTQETLTTVCCTSRDLVLQDYFAHTCEAIVRIVGPTPTLGPRGRRCTSARRSIPTAFTSIVSIGRRACSRSCM